MIATLLLVFGMMTGHATTPMPNAPTTVAQLCAYSNNGQVYLYTAQHC